MKKFVLSFLISLMVFGIIIVGLEGNFFSKTNSIIAADNSHDDEEEDLIEPQNKDELLFLLMGIDGNDVTKSKGTRTDTMILVKMNFKEGSIDLLSIPRDTRVFVKGKLDKINHAHAFGGSDLSIRTVREFLNIDLEYFVKVDYQVVKGVVEAIGGIDIDVPVRMRHWDPTAKPALNIDLQPGLQELDGKNAHDFLRFRGYPNGDIGRVEAQQYFMKEFVKQTLKAKNILKIPKLIEEYYKNVETNIPLTAMLRGAASANKIDMEKMNTLIIPGTPKTINAISYYIYDETGTKEIVEENLEDYLLY
ncbi:MAG TPA: LCP family protein [Tissierellaceae bacterium]|nr:LCP family protein [Tissierellaceae bacterium]